MYLKQCGNGKCMLVNTDPNEGSKAQYNLLIYFAPGVRNHLHNKNIHC